MDFRDQVDNPYDERPAKACTSPWPRILAIVAAVALVCGFAVVCRLVTEAR